MTTASTIESFFALINQAVHRPPPSHPACRVSQTVRLGQTLRLPAGHHVCVVTGQLWLTHQGDSRDHFPHGGDSFDTGTDGSSVVQALTDSTILIQ